MHTPLFPLAFYHTPCRFVVWVLRSYYVGCFVPTTAVWRFHHAFLHHQHHHFLCSYGTYRWIPTRTALPRLHTLRSLPFVLHLLPLFAHFPPPTTAYLPATVLLLQIYYTVPGIPPTCMHWLHLSFLPPLLTTFFLFFTFLHTVLRSTTIYHTILPIPTEFRSFVPIHTYTRLPFLPHTPTGSTCLLQFWDLQTTVPLPPHYHLQVGYLFTAYCIS